MNRLSMLLRTVVVACVLPMVSAAQEAPAKPPAHTYRLTYTLTESDGTKRVGVQHITLTVSPPSYRGTVKMGEKVPVATGSYMADGKNTVQTQFTYLDVGLSISATITEDARGVQLSSKVEQSSVTPGPASLPQDPIVRQLVLENTSMLSQGKPVVLGSLDLPDSTRHMEVQVMMEIQS